MLLLLFFFFFISFHDNFTKFSDQVISNCVGRVIASALRVSARLRLVEYSGILLNDPMTLVAEQTRTWNQPPAW